MTRKTRIGLGVAGALLVLTAYAVSTTMATKVTPTSTKTKATLVAKETARFLFGNAKSKESVRCDKSSFETETPPGGGNEENINRPKTGAYSRGLGSVRLRKTQLPLFEDCGYYLDKGAGPVKEAAATVTATGAWSANARAVKVADGPWPYLALVLPANGIEIKFKDPAQKKDRTLIIAPDGADAISGTYENGSGDFRPDSQLTVLEGAAETILQFEAKYNLSPKLKIES